MSTGPTQGSGGLSPRLVAIGCSIGFVALYGLAVRTGMGRSIDDAAVRLHNLDRIARRDEHLTRLVLDLVSVCLLPVVVWAGRRRRRDLAMLLGASFLAFAVAEVARRLLGRPVDLMRDPLWSTSFPSGHAAFAMGMCLSLLVLTGGVRWARWLGVLVAAGTAGIVVAFPIHRPSDLVAGFLLALGALVLVAPFATGGDSAGTGVNVVDRATVGEAIGRVLVAAGLVLCWARLHTLRSHLSVGALGWAFPVAVVVVCAAAEATTAVFAVACGGDEATPPVTALNLDTPTREVVA